MWKLHKLPCVKLKPKKKCVLLLLVLVDNKNNFWTVFWVWNKYTEPNLCHVFDVKLSFEWLYLQILAKLLNTTFHYRNWNQLCLLSSYLYAVKVLSNKLHHLAWYDIFFPIAEQCKRETKFGYCPYLSCHAVTSLGNLVPLWFCIVSLAMLKGYTILQ